MEEDLQIFALFFSVPGFGCAITRWMKKLNGLETRYQICVTKEHNKVSLKARLSPYLNLCNPPFCQISKDSITQFKGKNSFSKDHNRHTKVELSFSGQQYQMTKVLMFVIRNGAF